MATTRITIAKPDIIRFFDDYRSHVLALGEIAAILSEHRGFWRLAQRTTTEHFIEFLTTHAKLKLVEFKFPQRPKKCYVWGEVPLYEILLHVQSGVHFSHYTAMQMHGLTEQIPKSIYLTSERSAGTNRVSISQAEIKAAFAGPARVSNNWVELGDNRIYLLNGAYTNYLGVVNQVINDGATGTITVRLTGLERTLIDIAVRPFYAGGVFEVAKAFENALGDVSINKLVSMLQKLDFIYPYHQAIGYYLEHAGYKTSQIELLENLPKERDFYLTHGMGATTYVEKWRLFVPQGF
ncbi:MAG: hypothetical protein GW907_10785 [Betaproteobacteria bacterium]|nr:hypothetical protein [Betaproteobacteria bacterium]NCS61621.1 hypothetical protein [Rhodoferax sp.]OIP15552.1 MAG: hypothetical protein AUK50_10445 [Comamonadaceae bacterium CG2_30_57_122]